MTTALLFALALQANARQVSRNRSEIPGDHRDIVQVLLPKDQPPAIPHIAKHERLAVIKTLLQKQANAGGERAQKIAFLLAALGINYTHNRDYLVHVLQGCGVPSIKYGCSWETGQFLILLYENAHPDVLPSLLLAGSQSYDSMLSEELGDFSGNVLARQPGEFLSAIRPFTLKKQNEICEMAGLGDGGGISPEALKSIHENLSAIGGRLAHRCLREVESAAKSQ